MKEILSKAASVVSKLLPKQLTTGSGNSPTFSIFFSVAATESAMTVGKYLYDLKDVGNLISLRRKFETPGEGSQDENMEEDSLVNWKISVLVLFLPCGFAGMRVLYRRMVTRQKRIDNRIMRVIEISEKHMVTCTREKIEYSTEYTNLSVTQVREMFKQGCVRVCRDATDSSQALSITRDMFRTGDLTLSLSSDLLSQTDVPINGVWHAIWNTPPVVNAGPWETQGKTQKISYDIIDLGRSNVNSGRRQIKYICANDNGLHSSWLLFFYEINDGLPNFLRSWTKCDWLKHYLRIVYDHTLWFPPGVNRPMLVPNFARYKSRYLLLHRIKMISDKMNLTMRSDGSWNETVFLTTYRNLLQGNSSTNMGHRSSDAAMMYYLPYVRERLLSLRAGSGISN
jgi:hypothetical protein